VKSLNPAGTTTTLTVNATVSNFEGGGFNLDGTLDVWLEDAAGTTVESYHATLGAEWAHLSSSTTAAGLGWVDNAHDSGNGISTTAKVSCSPCSGNSNVTVSFTITHPRPIDAASSRAFMRIRSLNRTVLVMSVS